MTKGMNTNHPVQGSKIKVEPIMNLEDITRIKEMIKGKPMYFALFVIGINTNLRASDLLALKVGDVKELEPMDEIELKEKKTGNIRRVTLNHACIEALDRLLFPASKWKDEDFLFTGIRGRLTVPSVNRLVKQWCRKAGIKGHFGSHTLRKTWGYHQRVTFGQDILVLTEVFGHASQRQTLAYLCIQPEEIKNVYANTL